MHITNLIYLLTAAVPLVGIVAVAVTQNTTAQFNVAGNRRQQFYNVTGSTVANFLVVGMVKILKVNIDADPQGNLTGYTVTNQSPTVGSSKVNFTTGGNFGPVNVEVIGN